MTEYDSTNDELKATLTALYSTLVTCGERDSCDVAIVTRLAIQQQVDLRINDGPGAVGLSLGADFGNVLVVGAHTAHYPMVKKQYVELNALASRLAKETGPLIVAGDFNATRQSRVLQDFSRSLDLHATTWLPTYSAVWGLPQLAIDQILVSPNIEYLGPQASGDAAGSDHVPLARSFAIPVP